MSTSSGSSGGVGITGLLFVLFVGLKLGGVIEWSWWWVTAPLWVPLAVAMLFLVDGPARCRRGGGAQVTCEGLAAIVGTGPQGET